jgi:hypothetical protein
MANELVVFGRKQRLNAGIAKCWLLSECRLIFPSARIKSTQCTMRSETAENRGAGHGFAIGLYPALQKKILRVGMIDTKKFKRLFLNKNKWIKIVCKNDLPAINQKVLAIQNSKYNSEKIIIAQRRCLEFYGEFQDLFLCKSLCKKCTAEHKWVWMPDGILENYEKITHVTHWRPLPDYPDKK